MQQRKYSAALSEWQASQPAAAPATAPASGGTGLLRVRRKDVPIFQSNWNAQDRLQNQNADNKRLDEAAADKGRQEKESEASRGVLFRFFKDPKYELTDADAAAIAKDPNAIGILSQHDDRRRRRILAEEKATKSASDEAETSTSARAQVADVIERAKAAGFDIGATPPNLDKVPAREAIRVARSLERNYDDAFRAKQAETTRALLTKKAGDVATVRAVQHQVDEYWKKVQAKRKVLDGLQTRLSKMEAWKDDPAMAATYEGLADAVEDAREGLGQDQAALRQVTEILGRHVGLQNMLDPETRLPMASTNSEGEWDPFASEEEARAAFEADPQAKALPVGSPERKALAAKYRSRIRGAK